MAGSSFFDSIYDAIPSASDVGEFLGFNVPKYGLRGTQTGLSPASGESYGFLDLAGDIGGTAYDYGKSAYKWGANVIKSDTFKDIVAVGKRFSKKLKHEGAGDLAFRQALADMAPKGTQASAFRSQPFIGFRATQRGRTAGPGGRPSSWDMVDALKQNRRIMNNIRAEMSGQGYGAVRDTNNVNLSPNALLKSIAVRNPYKVGVSGSVHKLQS